MRTTISFISSYLSPIAARERRRWLITLCCGSEAGAYGCRDTRGRGEQQGADGRPRAGGEVLLTPDPATDASALISFVLTFLLVDLSATRTSTTTEETVSYLQVGQNASHRGPP